MKTHARARWLGSLIGALGVAVAIVGSATPGTSSSLVAPNATLDQSNSSRASVCGYSGWTPDSANEWVAQTFTAGTTGSLTDVVLSLWVNNSQDPVAIVPVDAGGRPVVSAPLASTTLTAEATHAYVDIDIAFSTPARVEAGKQYAIVLYAPSREAWVWKADLGASVVDPSGTTRCSVGAYAGGRYWLSNSPDYADADFFFQTYVVPARRVTVEKTGTGTGLVQDGTKAIDCGSACSGEFLQGQTVILTATPDRGSTFSGWSGGNCAGSAPTCSVPVSSDMPVTAAFTKALVMLRVSAIGRGAVTSRPTGIACGRACSRTLVPGPLKLTAKPSKGWRFARWQGACRGTRPTCQLTLTRTSSVSAIFKKT
jgi:hypothetical protein